MKRIGNLYTAICDMNNIRHAHEKARRGKRHYREVKMVDADPERYLTMIHQALKQKTFRNGEYVMFTRTECGKTREIFKLPYFPDRIIHHCIMNVLEPIWMKAFIRDTYSSMPGRGIHDGVRRVKKFLRDAPGTAYCLKLDIKKFYPSIDHNILKRLILRKIKCKGTLNLLDEIIDSAEGVPIGNYLSQYFGNLYLTYFDHWIKEKKGVRYYARYCDDIVLFHKDKAFLHELFREIREYLQAELRLKVKEDWQVFPTRTRGLDFMGYRFFGTHTLIRKRISQAFQRRVLNVEKRRPAAGDLNALMSYYGWLKHGNGFNLWEKYINTGLRTRIAAVGLESIPKQLQVR